jgi:hypothetical protein
MFHGYVDNLAKESQVEEFKFYCYMLKGKSYDKRAHVSEDLIKMTQIDI